MKRTIEVVGKKVEEAIAEGLRIFATSIDEVDVKVINAGGLFKKAKIEMSFGEDEPATQAVETKIAAKASVSVKTESKNDEVKKSVNEAVENKRVQANQPAVSKNGNKYENKPKENIRQAAAPENKPRDISGETKQGLSNQNNFKPQNRNFDKPKTESAVKRNFEERPRESAVVTKEQIDKCQVYLATIVEKMGIEATVTAVEKDGIDILIDTKDSAIIGRRGETLDALQYLTSLLLNENGGRFVHLNVDALGYRAARIENLKSLALNMAEKCINTSRKVMLDPMSSAERRVVHAALQDNDKVVTRSEGHEPARRIVIIPATPNK